MAKRRTGLDDFEQKQALKKKDGAAKAKRKRVKPLLELPNEKQVWFAPKAAAAYLGLGVSTLAKMRSAKPPRGPAWSAPCPNSVRYRREDLDAFMASRRVQQGAE